MPKEKGDLSQCDRVAQVLRYARAQGKPWVCGTRFYDVELLTAAGAPGPQIPTYAQRISQLKTRGYTISVKQCPHDFHTGNVAAYRLISEPGEKPKESAVL